MIIFVKSLTITDFIIKSKLKHGNKYNYSKSVYVNARTNIEIICPIHGEFWQKPQSHYDGCGCDKCGGTYTYTTEEFINRSNIIHNNKYDYSLVKYKNNKTKVKIICKEHGIFEQIPNSHILGQGCPKCNYSKGELLIYNWLKNNNIKFKDQFEIIMHKIARNSNNVIIDFFVIYNEKQYFIEYDGIQHFEYISYLHKGNIINFKNQQRRDNVLNEFCELHKDKVTLIRFNYKQSNDEIINQLNQIFHAI